MRYEERIIKLTGDVHCFKTPEDKQKMYNRIKQSIRHMEELAAEVAGIPTLSEIIRDRIELDIDNAWEKYPRIAYEVDFALCGSDWAISELPLKELPKIVEEAVAKYGEELEQEIDSSLIRDEDGEIQSQGDMTGKHLAFLGWLKSYPVLDV